MITQNTYNGKTKEHLHFDDIQEGFIKQNKLNSTELERKLVRVNVGSKRRLRNNHKQRLAQFKALNN